MDAEEELPTFRPFTREELATIDNRIFENKLAEKKKQERRDKNIAVSNFQKYSLKIRKEYWQGGGGKISDYSSCVQLKPKSRESVLKKNLRNLFAGIRRRCSRP